MTWAYFETRDEMASRVSGWEWVDHELNWTGPGWYFNSGVNTWMPAEAAVKMFEDEVAVAVENLNDAVKRTNPKPNLQCKLTYVLNTNKD